MNLLDKQFDFQKLYNEFIQQKARDYDNMLVKFLNNNGYNIKLSECTAENLSKIHQELEKDGLFIDVIERSIIEDYDRKSNTLTQTTYMVPFFNSYSNPLSDEDKEQIIKIFIEKNRGVK